MTKDELLEHVRQYLQEHPMKQKEEYAVTDWSVTDDDFIALVSASVDRWVTEGVLSDKFRFKLAEVIGTRYCALVNSGSSANLLAVTVCKDHWGNKNGQKVITCATAFPTTVAPIIQNGLVPLFIDIDPRTLTSNIYTIEKLLEREDVVGIILAHNLGFAQNETEIATLCHKHNKWYVADCCDALGTKDVGIYCDVATLSFFPAHHITTGEGGAVLTNNSKLYRLIQQYGNWGRDCWCSPGQSNTCNKRFAHNFGTGLPVGYDHKYSFTKVGYNFKMTELQAALGYSQIQRLPEFIQKRRSNYQRLYEIISNSSQMYGSVKLPDGCSPFGFPIMSYDYWYRKTLVDTLENHNIRTRPIFSGNLLKHPMMQNIEHEVGESLIGSDMVMNRMIFVGVHPSVTEENIKKFEEIMQNI